MLPISFVDIKWCASNQMIQEKAENSPEVYDYISTAIMTNEDEKTQHITAPKFSLACITDSESLPEHCAKGKERVNRQRGERMNFLIGGHLRKLFKKPAALHGLSM